MLLWYLTCLCHLILGNNSRADEVSPSRSGPPPLYPLGSTPPGGRGPPLHYTNQRQLTVPAAPCPCCHKLSDEIAKLRQDVKDMVEVVRTIGRENLPASSEYHLPVFNTVAEIQAVDEYTPEEVERLVRRLAQIGGKNIRDSLRNMISAMITEAVRPRINKTGKNGKLNFFETELYRAMRGM